MYRLPRHLRSVAAALLLALVAAAPARAGGTELPAPLAPFTAEYRLGNGSFRVGTSTLRLEPHARGWRYESVTEAEGLLALFVDGPVVERTLLGPHAGRLRPLEYHHLEPDGDTRVLFDWAAGEARAHTPDGVRTIALAPDTHDQFSVMLAVMQALAAGRDEVRLPGIDDEGEREPLSFAAEARETITVPLGRYDTVRVRRIRDGKRSTVTWLAPELGWLPVRVEQRKRGDLVARLELSALNGEEAPPERRPGRRR
jgi:hypothetical protein